MEYTDEQVRLDYTTPPSVPNNMQDKRKEVPPPRVALPVKILLSLFSALFIASGILIPSAFVWENRALLQEKKFRQNDTAFLVSELEEMKQGYKDLIGSGDAGKNFHELYGKMETALRLHAAEQMKNEEAVRTDALEDLRGDVASQKADQGVDRRKAAAEVAAVSSRLQSDKTALKQKHADLEAALEGAQANLKTEHVNLQTTLGEKHDELKTALETVQTNLQTTLLAKHGELETKLEGKHAHFEAVLDKTVLSTALKHVNLETTLGEKHDELKTTLEGAHADLNVRTGAVEESHANLRLEHDDLKTTLEGALAADSLMFAEARRPANGHGARWRQCWERSCS